MSKKGYKCEEGMGERKNNQGSSRNIIQLQFDRYLDLYYTMCNTMQCAPILGHIQAKHLPLNYGQPTNPPTATDRSALQCSKKSEGRNTMEKLTLGDQKSIINLTQFVATIWAVCKTRWEWNKWKIVTLVQRMQM